MYPINYDSTVCAQEYIDRNGGGYYQYCPEYLLHSELNFGQILNLYASVFSKAKVEEICSKVMKRMTEKKEFREKQLESAIYDELLEELGMVGFKDLDEWLESYHEDIASHYEE